jgi:transposase
LIKKYKNTFNVCRKIYNLCVDWIEEKPKETPTLKLLRLLFINSDSIHNEKFKEVPYEMKDGVLRDFITALKVSKKLVKTGKIKFFDMKHRTKKGNQSLNIPHKYIKNKNNTSYYMFPTFFGKNSLNCKKKISQPKHDCRFLLKDGNFYLAIPVDKKIKDKKINRIECSIDPGERNFNTLYGTDEKSYLIGKSKKIDDLTLRASNLRNGVGKNGEKINNRKKRKNVIKIAENMERKAKNLVYDVNHKLCKFITVKYSNVIIPEFKTKEMVMRKEDKRRKIGKGTARRLIRWSHYKFRQLLIAKGEKNNCKINVETEEWTSKTCGNCFKVKENLGGSKEYKCNNCKVEIDRDVNGARNIMILNYKKMEI